MCLKVVDTRRVGRIGEVKEIVDAAFFLTDATFTSGEILHVDGGAHAGKW
jgi:NAD(P)-dependent dehydrogenase (short-subunit alcohol dehydrogenase family)